MALAISPVQSVDGTHRRIARVVIGAAGDYSSGLTLDPAALGVRLIAGVNALGSSVGAVWVLDPSSGKLRAYLQGAGAGALTEATGAQVAGATILLEVIEAA